MNGSIPSLVFKAKVMLKSTPSKQGATLPASRSKAHPARLLRTSQFIKFFPSCLLSFTAQVFTFYCSAFTGMPQHCHCAGCLQSWRKSSCCSYAKGSQKTRARVWGRLHSLRGQAASCGGVHMRTRGFCFWTCLMISLPIVCLLLQPRSPSFPIPSHLLTSFPPSHTPPSYQLSFLWRGAAFSLQYFCGLGISLYRGGLGGLCDFPRGHSLSSYSVY